MDNPVLIDSRHTIHLCVDLQKIFYPLVKCDGSDKIRADVARHVAMNIAPRFNTMNVPTYWIYADPLGMGIDWLNKYGDGFPEEAIIQDKDKTFRKKDDCNSAHQGTRLDKLPESAKWQTEILSGFHADKCIAATAFDAAAKGRKVIILTDGIDKDAYNDWNTVKPELLAQGVILADSSELEFAALRIAA